MGTTEMSQQFETDFQAKRGIWIVPVHSELFANSGQNVRLLIDERSVLIHKVEVPLPSTILLSLSIGETASPLSGETKYLAGPKDIRRFRRLHLRGRI